MAVTVLVMASCSGGDDPEPNETPAAKKYDIKSGTIHFETELLWFKGTKIVYFDDYGAKERVETYDGETLETSVFSDGKTRYHLNHAQKIAFVADHEGDRGWEMEFHAWEEIQKFPGYQEDYTRLDNMIIVGKDCEAFRYRDMATFAGWKGLTLYHEQEGARSIAVKLEENVSHDPSLFAVPPGYTVQDLP